jgi:hypothetical protein
MIAPAAMYGKHFLTTPNGQKRAKSPAERSRTR